MKEGKAYIGDEIAEANKLIAEFMGSCGLELKGVPNDGIVRNCAKYHSSWDWLMPVVEKIQSKGYDFFIFNDEDGEQAMIYGAGFSYSIDPTSIVIPNKPGTGNNKITTVWETIIEFITWHNS